MSLKPKLFDLQWWKQSWRDVRLTLRLVTDSSVPLYLKLIPAFLLIYIISPLDAIPTFVPVVGQLDDVALLLMGCKLFVQLAPDDVVEKHVNKAAT